MLRIRKMMSSVYSHIYYLNIKFHAIVQEIVFQYNFNSCILNQYFQLLYSIEVSKVSRLSNFIIFKFF
ncbi:hypothetical protein FGO68_gene11714 [Halteria grandinella]|uniref:Uncharacterized protein n=1 Tax=Halteria grandinella TaxID=5974 RepID=A0A8J8SV74_HALGN|nr:hypothetical protein FGO68_gene11714 [Halteria grandinella]